MIMTFVRKVKKESKLLTGFPTLNMRLPSLCMQALSLGYSTVWANRAGGQSTIRLWLITSPQERTAFPVNREFLLNLLNSVSLNSIIQGAGHAREKSNSRAWPAPTIPSSYLLRSAHRLNDCLWIRSSRTRPHMHRCAHPHPAPPPHLAPCPRRISDCHKRVR